jgi:hypothetical protein
MGSQSVPASHATGVKLQHVITKIRRHLFVFDNQPQFRPPTTAPNERRAPTSFSAKSPMASA